MVFGLKRHKEREVRINSMRKKREVIKHIQSNWEVYLFLIIFILFAPVSLIAVIIYIGLPSISSILLWSPLYIVCIWIYYRGMKIFLVSIKEELK